MQKLSWQMVLVMLIVLSRPAYSCELTFAVSSEFPPYHILQPDHTWGGLSVELFRLLAEEANCQVKVIDVPWVRTLELLRKGKIDAVSNYSFNEQRQQYSYFIGPHAIERIVLIVHNKFAHLLQNNEDLKNFPGLIGKTQGTYYGDELETLVHGNELKTNLVNITSNANRVGMIAKGRVDAILEEETVAQYFYKIGIFDEQILVQKLSFSENPIYFGFSRQSLSEERIQQLRSAWLRVKQNNKFTAVYEKYGSSYQTVSETMQKFAQENQKTP
jgi:polar amino acid transport system substrate-binding protein